MGKKFALHYSLYSVKYQCISASSASLIHFNVCVLYNSVTYICHKIQIRSLCTPVFYPPTGSVATDRELSNSAYAPLRRAMAPITFTLHCYYVAFPYWWPPNALNSVNLSADTVVACNSRNVMPWKLLCTSLFKCVCFLKYELRLKHGSTRLRTV